LLKGYANTFMLLFDGLFNREFAREVERKFERTAQAGEWLA
jgi:hypothetical protein